MKTIHTRLLAVLPSLKALGRWLALAGLTGLACGLAGAAFTWTVGWSTALRGAHPWFHMRQRNFGLFLFPKRHTALPFFLISSDFFL